MVPLTWFVCQLIKVDLFEIKKGEGKTLFVRCACGVTSALFQMWGYHYISVGKGMLIFNLGSLIQTLFGHFLLGEIINWVDLASPPVAMAGIGYMVFNSE